MATIEEMGIELTQAGQPRPYADSVYAGTVKADTKEEARTVLSTWQRVETIPDRQDKEKWSWPYFTKLRERETGLWEFTFVKEYTG